MACQNTLTLTSQRILLSSLRSFPGSAIDDAIAESKATAAAVENLPGTRHIQSEVRQSYRMLTICAVLFVCN